uniref:Uncharacterized protein n=1 Tax=Chrysotila carterae TaxID=13221 RepID=A0A6S9V091_CHRCT|mmetsp:Transcript_26124/g.50751  ORF Transcript_26124/g.50751 Transcript_26124/m.50751 type:complete len:100 (-) Transcript_26124:24-323(-)
MVGVSWGDQVAYGQGLAGESALSPVNRSKCLPANVGWLFLRHSWGSSMATPSCAAQQCSSDNACMRGNLLICEFVYRDLVKPSAFRSNLIVIERTRADV